MTGFNRWARLWGAGGKPSPPANETDASLGKEEGEQISAVRDFLAGRSDDLNLLNGADTATRELVGEEPLAAMSRAGVDHSTSQTETGTPGAAEAPTEPLEPADDEAIDEQQSELIDQDEQERVGKLLMEKGLFDEAVQDLRRAISAPQRAAAARALGLVGNKRGTPHLIAAMFDDDPGVRDAAEESLGQVNSAAEPIDIGNPQTDDIGNLDNLETVELEMVKSEVVEPKSETMTSESAASETMNSETVETVKSEGVAASLSATSAETDESVLQEPMVMGEGPQDASHHKLRVVTTESEAQEGSAQQESHTGSSSVLAGLEEIEAALQKAAQNAAAGGEADPPQAAEREGPGPRGQTEQLTHGGASKEPEELLLEEQTVRESVKQLDRQLIDAANARAELEKEAVLSVQRESRLRAEAAKRRREEEELRKQAEQEAEARKRQDLEALEAEQLARTWAEAKAHKITENEASMRLEASSLRLAAEEFVWQRMAIETARREAAEAARRAEAKSARAEAERRHNGDLARLRNEEDALRSATEEAARRRAEIAKANEVAKADIERLAHERVQLASAEAFRHAEATQMRLEAKNRHEAEVKRLQSEEEALRAVAEQVAQRRAEVAATHREANIETERLSKERAQLAAADNARRAEMERIREASEKNRIDHEQLLLELEGLRLVNEEAATRRAEVEASRKKADEEAERLLEAQSRMRAEEDARARAESERMQLEADLLQQVKMQQRLLDETRRRGEEEQRRMEEEAKRYAEQQEKHQAEIREVQKNAETVAQQRAEEERQILSQVESLRIADAEARKRIEEIEARRRKSEDVYRLVAEKVQRVEAEAHVRALEEEKILAKLEAVRRSAAVEAQARAAQEKRIKEEIELFRKLEMEERPRLEVAALQRAEAERLSQQRIDRDKSEGEIRARAEEFEGMDVHAPRTIAGTEGPQLREEGATVNSLEAEVPQTTDDKEAVSEASDKVDEHAAPVEDESNSAVTSIIQAYLNSVDPHKRVAAVAELSRSKTKEAFDAVAKCFDDSSLPVRDAAARALLKIDPARTVELFNRGLEDGPEERRRRIGTAIAGSGLAADAIRNLVGGNREDTYNALSILFVMAKTGEVQPLVKAIQQHPSSEVSEAAIKLLTLSGKSEIANAALKQRANGRLGR